MPLIVFTLCVQHSRWRLHAKIGDVVVARQYSVSINPPSLTSRLHTIVTEHWERKLITKLRKTIKSLLIFLKPHRIFVNPNVINTEVPATSPSSLVVSSPSVECRNEASRGHHNCSETMGFPQGAGRAADTSAARRRWPFTWVIFNTNYSDFCPENIIPTLFI